MSRPFDRRLWHVSGEELRQLAETGLGKKPADLVIRDGTVVNVYTGELQEHCDVSIKDRRIAFVGKKAQAIGPETEVIDAKGKFVIPGLIDGHSHLARCDLSELIRYAAPTGTTTIVLETMDLAFSLGLSCLDWLMEAAHDQPVRLLFLLPALCSNDPPGPATRPSIEECARYLDEDAILGIGESYWADVLRGDDHLLALLALAQSHRKAVEGHTAGARESRLQAYFATGATSCHEPITEQETIERLRLGVHAMLRQGAVRSDLAAASTIRNAGVDLRRLVIVSDSVRPQDLLAGQYMNAIVQAAIDLGFSPIDAVRMASLNVAEHFHLDQVLGGVAPGRIADLVIIPDIRRIDPELVLNSGRVVARDGTAAASPRALRYPSGFCQAINLPPHFTSSDFEIVAQGGASMVRIRAMRQVTPLVTQEEQLDLIVREGQVRPETERDIAKVAAVDRRGGAGERFVGFVQGLGIRRGAIATTMSWDSTAMVVVGMDDTDMAMAMNHLIAQQGGAVVYCNGRLIASFEARVAGAVSNKPLPQVVSALEDVSSAARAIGMILPDPLLTVDTLSTAAIPHFRLSYDGYHSLRDGKRYDLFVSR